MCKQTQHVTSNNVTSSTSASFVFFVWKEWKIGHGNETVVECLTMTEWDLIGYGQMVWSVIVLWLIVTCSLVHPFKVYHWVGFNLYTYSLYKTVDLQNDPQKSLYMYVQNWVNTPLTFAQGIPRAAVSCIMGFTCTSFHVGQGEGYFRNFWVGMCCWDPGILSLA